MPEATLIDADRPLALLPVRLETRFFGQELRVRIYPDTIHIDTHEPELTADEMEWGRHFHELVWRASHEDDRQQAAWAQLAGRFGAERAAWIALQLTPVNGTDRPATPLGPGDPISHTASVPHHTDPAGRSIPINLDSCSEDQPPARPMDRDRLSRQ